MPTFRSAVLRYLLCVALFASPACSEAMASQADGQKQAESGNSNRAWKRAEAQLDAAAKAGNWSYIPSLGDKARAGDPASQFELGVAYATGKLVAKDAVPAMKWIRVSAEQGYADAQYTLGTLLEKSAKSPEDYAASVSWWRRAAEQGHAPAQASLGSAYKSGRGIKQDFAEAFRWYENSAAQGYGFAQFNLAIAYATGQGVKLSDDLALRWALRAAESGNAVAQFYVGHVLANGLHGSAIDKPGAVSWWEKAANQGFRDAQGRLGAAYQFGEGVNRDEIQAMKWFLIAAKQKLEPAVVLVEELKNEMDPDAFASAQALADRWKPDPTP